MCIASWQLSDVYSISFFCAARLSILLCRKLLSSLIAAEADCLLLSYFCIACRPLHDAPQVSKSRPCSRNVPFWDYTQSVGFNARGEIIDSGVDEHLSFGLDDSIYPETISRAKVSPASQGPSRQVLYVRPFPSIHTLLAVSRLNAWYPPASEMPDSHPTSSPSTDPRLRKACDRCHAQKLGCQRSPGTRKCVRCTKADKPCTWSISLRNRRNSTRLENGGNSQASPRQGDHRSENEHGVEPHAGTTGKKLVLLLAGI